MRWEIALPTTLYLIYRSYTHASLTPLGIATAALTATIHALHPSPLPFVLLIVFFLLGTSATKVKKEVKANLTLSSTGRHTRNGPSGSALGNVFGGGWNKTQEYHEKREAGKKKGAGESTAGGQEARSAVQVLANSGWVSLLCLGNVFLYGGGTTSQSTACLGAGGAQDLILVGIVSNYAAVTADTLSSELGILSSYKPRFILSLREVPPGTNGGVTGAGLFAGLAGALIIGAVSATMLPSTCGSWSDTSGLILAIGSWGALGSVLDSVLGALLQASVVDRRSGKIVEAPNGGRVKYFVGKEKVDNEESKPSRILGSGKDILDNNQVNALMAGVMTLGGIVLASRAWDVPLGSLWMKS